MRTKAPASQQEATLATVRNLPRERLMDELLHFKGALRLDFTEEFLSRLSDDKLRHILLAACIYGHPYRLPKCQTTGETPEPSRDT